MPHPPWSGGYMKYRTMYYLGQLTAAQLQICVTRNWITQAERDGIISDFAADSPPVPVDEPTPIP